MPDNKEKRPNFMDDIREQTDKVIEDLKEWGIDLEKFQEQLNKAGDEAKVKLEKSLNEMQERIEEEREENTESAQEFADRMNAAWKELLRGVAAAGERLTEKDKSKDSAQLTPEGVEEPEPTDTDDDPIV